MTAVRRGVVVVAAAAYWGACWAACFDIGLDIAPAPVFHGYYRRERGCQVASDTLTAVQTYTIMQCTHEGCGVHFALNDDYIDARRKDRRTWYCPNGHGRWYPGKTEAQEERERAEEARAAAERLRRQLKRREEDLQAERRSHSATKGQLTKTRKRADHAMCPVEGCKRSFVNVARHIANQHPGYKAHA